MNNKLVLTLLVILIAQTYAQSCKDHAIYTKAKAFLNDRVAQDSSLKGQVDSFISSFEGSTAKTQSAEELGVCSSYSTQSTCCTKDIVNQIEKLAFLRVKNINKNQQKPDILTKIARVLKNLLVRSDCNGKGKANPSEDDVKGLPKIEKIKSNVKDAQKKLNQGLVRAQRGALCALCHDPTTANTLIVSGKIQVNLASNNEYKAVVEEAMDKLATNVDPASADFKAFIQEAITNLAGGDAKCQTFAQTKLDQILAQNNRPKKEKCSQMTQLFPVGEGQCEKASKIEGDIEGQSNSGRMLADATDDAEVVANGGVKVYIVSTLDDKMDENGLIEESFSSKIAFVGLSIIALIFF